MKNLKKSIKYQIVIKLYVNPKKYRNITVTGKSIKVKEEYNGN
jgi:hypothetical protein